MTQIPKKEKSFNVTKVQWQIVVDGQTFDEQNSSSKDRLS